MIDWTSTRFHRFAPALNGYQIKNACLWLAKHDNEITTESYIDFLRWRNLTGDVDMEEVESVDWTDLKGLVDRPCDTYSGLEASV